MSTTFKIYCINLDHRTDRWQDAQKNHRANGLVPEEISRWSAIVDKDFGALGCTKSHVSALTHFLTRETAPYCVILEDDFDFTRPVSEFVACFNRLAEHHIEWDVLLLTGTAVLAYEPNNNAGAARIFESQTTAGYVVSRNYVPTLLACFAETIPAMEKMRHIRPREFATMRLAVDMVWKRLQRNDRWYICHPAIGRQRPSFSDIMNQHVDYGAVTYGVAQP
ncbi:glycosyltransferase family 25 protein [Paraburkholderia ginsengisoli]|uniref:Glycosyl transferase family 25 n=1 Tax=Paraburkholderia ginsengisoli TaxID=311231 RepID=A0A7T4N0K0_9BURK|nr:hypothetical protein [Paraburkholderia ginsengisoli]QQC63011.1 hypothetical protein I6I06_11890 [Paraburkholderia ginsengisoli]